MALLFTTNFQDIYNACVGKSRLTDCGLVPALGARRSSEGQAHDPDALSGRFVGWRAIAQDSLADKEPACIKPDKLLHELLTFVTDKK